VGIPELMLVFQGMSPEQLERLVNDQRAILSAEDDEREMEGQPVIEARPPQLEAPKKKKRGSNGNA